MHPDLEHLINMALADGQVTDKERGIIFRKAESLGEDIDETEMILDGRIALMNKEQQTSHPEAKNSNSGDQLTKCPDCGASYASFNTKCPFCGHEYRNVEAAVTVRRLYDDLQQAAITETEEYNRNPPKWYEQNLAKEFAIAKKIAERQGLIISTFPIPNTKEDILELLSMSASEASKKVPFAINKQISAPHILKNAWLSKCEQVIMKARFSMKSDRKALEEIEVYAKKLGIK